MYIVTKKESSEEKILSERKRRCHTAGDQDGACTCLPVSGTRGASSGGATASLNKQEKRNHTLRGTAKTVSIAHFGSLITALMRNQQYLYSPLALSSGEEFNPYSEPSLRTPAPLAGREGSQEPGEATWVAALAGSNLIGLVHPSRAQGSSSVHDQWEKDSGNGFHSVFVGNAAVTGPASTLTRVRALPQRHAVHSGFTVHQ